MQRRRGFLGRIADSLRNFAGRFNPTPPPEEPEPPEEVLQPTVPPPEPEEEEPVWVGGIDFIPPDRVRYIPEHNVGKYKVIDRWKVGNESDPADIRDVRDIFNAAGYRAMYTFAITGIPCYEYPTKPGENKITLSYKIEGNSLWQYINDPDSLSAESWINNMLSEMEVPIGNCWDIVQSIDVLDK
jgi:hypothetical protein